jgi:selenocysteine lyase/cysteine desulfurase
LQRVIAAQQQVIHLAAVVGVQRALNSVTVILIDHAGAVILGGAEHHANLTIGQVLQVIKDVGAVFQLIQRSRPSTINSSMPTRTDRL